MSEDDLRKLGVGDVAFITKSKGVTSPLFVLRAADGTHISLNSTSQEAMDEANENNLSVAWLH